MIQTFNGNTPAIDDTAYIHPMATLIGQIKIGAGSSVWPSVVLRGDMGQIEVGEDTSIQDGTVIHLTEGFSNTRVGDRVTVGHNVVLHGCTVEDECLIGMGAIVLDNATIGKGSLVAAGALVTVGTQIPPGSLVMGSPAKVIRPVNEKDQMMIAGGWMTYKNYAQEYKKMDETN